MEFTWLSRWQPQLLALLRIVTGLLFLEHALSSSLAFPAPVQAILYSRCFLIAAIDRTGAGVLVIAGAVHPPCRFIAAGEMAVAYWMEHAPSGHLSGGGHGRGRDPVLLHFPLPGRGRAGCLEFDGARTRSAPIR